MTEPTTIEVRGAREHNLRGVSLALPRNSLIVFTGVSGSGKSSLAFDTLYAEGQRRYIESLSSYARQFMGQLPKPDCDAITGLSPSIAIQQKSTGWNPRSTVGTVTAIQDFLRVLYARIGIQHCTQCDKPISAQSRETIVAGILAAFASEPRTEVRGGARRGTELAGNSKADDFSRTPPADAGGSDRAGIRALILAPVAKAQKGEFRDLFEDLIRAGYVRARVDGQIVELRDQPALEKNQRHDIEVVIDRLTISADQRSRLAEAVENALRVGEGTLIVSPVDTAAAAPRDPDDDDDGDAENGAARRGRTKSGARAARTAKRKQDAGERVYSSRFACATCGISFTPPSPQMFSFNSPAGMCPKCDGLGEKYDFDPDLLVPDPSLNFFAPCVAALRTKIGRWRRHIFEAVGKAVGFDVHRPWKDLSKAAREALLFGTGDRHITYEWRWSGGVWKHGGPFEGVIAELREKYRKAESAMVRGFYEKYMRKTPCGDCKGARLTAQALAVRLPAKEGRGPTLPELSGRSIADTRAALDDIELTPVQHLIADEVLKEVRGRLDFLLNVGLHYLTLDRSAPTLSGGESQRIRLAGQIGAGLVGVLYILDEPSIGLHHRDNERLIESLIALRDMGNTVIVVEHDEATMRAADHIVDFGPGPGVRGGEVVAEGPIESIRRSRQSLTGRYLVGEQRIEVPVKRRPVTPQGKGS